MRAGLRGTDRPAILRPLETFTIAAIVLILARGWLVQLTDAPRVHSWLTVFVSVTMQALPFVALDTIVSASIAVLVPASFFARALPSRPALAVPVAGVAGVVLPGCECPSVPVAGALVRRA
jgi:uncharacterized membrane protein YraQ (UPF0718 family)